ncbi:MAG: type II secretion system minor pseudopilin GspI [Pseudomonadales bacterium]|nr:type II secretion system minor pseudopilin GspI [Pseudomonadales bacterium]
MRTSGRGFTLIEVMVALAIFAVASAALVRNATLSIRQTAQLRDRTTASWIAENEFAYLRKNAREDADYPPTRTQRKAVTMAGDGFDVETRVETTENSDVRRVTVSVYRPGEDSPIADLVGFVGRF